jgi:soluble lytic murein transglycosylase-like protein
MPIDKGNPIPLKCENMKCLRIFLITSLFLCPTVIFADIYRYVDRDGVVHFTNTPRDSKGELYLREAPKIPPRGRSSSPKHAWMMEYAERYSRANNLSPALVKAIIRAESNGERFAVSPKGAQGMMQLMPSTQRRMNVSDPFDPILNIEGGIRYIKELLGTFGGNLHHAVAAYNAGPAAVKKYGGIPPYPETRLYVKRVMDYYWQYQAAE